MAELYAGRYADAANEDLQNIILSELPYWDFHETLAFYEKMITRAGVRNKDNALLGANDRFFLLTIMLRRADAMQPWLFDRCREVESDEFGYIDLWARWHYKSTIITFAGTIQSIIRDPEVTIGIFSGTNKIARPFLAQIKAELETNADLITIYSDVFYENPKTEAPSWSVDKGITVKRRSNPKEATVEAYGVVDGMPTGRHFAQLRYDDLITEKHVTNPEMVAKVTERWELSDSLGIGEATKISVVGTRYSFADTYGIMIERGIAKTRLYPATDNGKLNGKPVFMSLAHWEKLKIKQRSVVSAQMLQNPIAGKENVFRPEWLVSWDVRPSHLAIYIMADPSSGRTSKSDRTAMAVVGVDGRGNKFFLDGYCHRMSLSERFEALKNLWRKWSLMRGVVSVKIGYERFGMQADIEYFNEKMREQSIWFQIDELNWPSEGGTSKRDRVERLEPDVKVGRFYLPALIYEPAIGEVFWSINHETSSLIKKKMDGPTRAMARMKEAGQDHVIVSAIRRLDEDRKAYDVTARLIEEMMFFPFAPRDDLVDATSRIYDMGVVPPTLYESEAAQELNSVAFPDA